MRIRTVKPEFFQDERLYDLEAQTGMPIRIIFVGLWCVCDREGRFDWNPRRLKVQILPHDEGVDFLKALEALAEAGFVDRYSSGGRELACVPGFGAHQVVNNKERPSVRPAPPMPAPPMPAKQAKQAKAPGKQTEDRKATPAEAETVSVTPTVTDLDKRACKVFRACGLPCDPHDLYRLGNEVPNLILESAQMLDDQGVAQMCRNAKAWRKASTWITKLTAKLILSQLGEIYSHEAEEASEKPRRLL